MNILKTGLALLPGLALMALLAAVALYLGEDPWWSRYGLSALSLAIVLGMLLGNTIYSPLAKRCDAGLQWGKTRLLRAGIVLYGFRLTLGQLAALGPAALLADALMLVSTFALAWYAGRRWLRMDAQTVVLMGAGSAICGAAAILATEPVVKAPAAKVSVAVATVVVFGTVGIFLYPQMYFWGLWPLDQAAYGIYIGSSVHEVAQVVAAGRSIDMQVADVALTAKMLRVMLLAPFLLWLSLWWLRQGGGSAGGRWHWRTGMPWFALYFVAVVVFNSAQWLPASWVAALVRLDMLLLTMAMAALGVSTRFSAVRQAGPRPLVLGLVLMVWLVLAGGSLQLLLSRGLAAW